MNKKGWALIEYGGEWEDKWERIVTIYLNKEKAERKKEKKNIFLTEEHETIQKCWDCMTRNDFLEVEDANDVEELKERLSKECDMSELSELDEEDGYYTCICKNDLTTSLRDDVSGYSIVEVDIDV